MSVYWVPGTQIPLSICIKGPSALGAPGMHSRISFSAHSGFRPYFIPLVSLPVASTFQNCDFSFQNCDFSQQTLKTRTPILRFPKERNVPKARELGSQQFTHTNLAPEAKRKPIYLARSHISVQPGNCHLYLNQRDLVYLI